MKKIIVASNNKHKIDEIKNIFSDINVEIKSLKDEDINIDVVEDGSTFEENSMKKGKEIALYLKNNNKDNYIVLSDDSGLEVEYLNNEPGIYSARYAGVHGDDISNNEKLLNKLNGVSMEKRMARFVCVISVVDTNNNSFFVRGQVKGKILEDVKGNGGFGYDPLFYYAPLNKTFAELTPEEKNKISHRAIALTKLKDKILDIL